VTLLRFKFAGSGFVVWVGLARLMFCPAESLAGVAETFFRSAWRCSEDLAPA
jgi:hypothetical protein